MDDDDNRSSTPKLSLGEVSRSSSPVVTTTTSYPVSVRQQMARIKQMEQPSPSGSTDGEMQAPLTPGGVTPGGAVGTPGQPRKKPPKVHRRNGRGETPLHVAAKKGDVIACEELVAEGAEVNQSDNAGWTPLHEAASNNRVDCVTFLLNNGANPNARSQFGDVPLHDAVHCNYVRLVWTLLKAGAKIDERCRTDNEENQKKEDQAERARKIYTLLTSPLPPTCPESEEEEEDSEEEKKKEKEKEEKEGGKDKKDKRKKEKKEKEEKKKHKELSSSTPRPSDKLGSSSSASASSSRTSLTTAATSVFESPQSGTVGGGTSAGSMHAPHLPPAHHSPSMATQIMKQPDQQLSVSTEHNERRLEDLPSSSRSIPATTPISVIVGEGEADEDEEEEDGEIMSEGGREKSEGAVPSSLLSIAADEMDDDDEEGKLMIDEGDDGEGEALGMGEEDVVEEEVETSSSPPPSQLPPSTLSMPIVNVQPPTPLVEKRMELMNLEKEEEEEEDGDSVTRDSDPIDEMGEELNAKTPSSSRAFSEDPPSTATGTAKKRKKTGDKQQRKAEKGAAKRAATGIGAWAKNRRSAEPETSSSAAVAAAIMQNDPFEFRDDNSSPDSRISRGVTMDRELSAPPVAKRQRLSRTQSPSPSRDVDMEDDEDEDTRQSGKKVPPLRLVLPPKPSDDGDTGDDAVPSTSHTPIPSTTRKQGRGRPPGKKGGDDESSAQRMTRSKVRQSGKGLDDGEGGGKRKRGRQNLAAVEEEAAGTEGDEYSAAPTPLMAVGEGAEMMGGDIDWNMMLPPTNEQKVYEITTQSTLMARFNLDNLVDDHLTELYKTDRTGPQWEPSATMRATFIMYNQQYTIADRPPPPGGWPPMVSVIEVAEEKERAARGEEIGTSREVKEEKKEEPAKKNRFEVIHPEMRTLWDELEKEREEVAAQMEQDRVTLRLSIERAVVIRERTMADMMNKLTFCKYLQLKETCNPHAVLDKQKLPNVERDVNKFIAHHEARVEELWKRHRFQAGNLAGMQVNKWRDQANQLGIKRGLRRQCRAFPELVPIRVPIPPIEDFVLPKPNDDEEPSEVAS